MATNMNTNENKISHKDLSYKLQGLFFDIRNDLGSGHKESIYQKALEKELTGVGIKFTREPPIKIYSKKGEFLGLYRPDFLVEDKIVIELKAVEHISRQENARVYDYLRNSKYELAYLVNFASFKLYVKRIIFTNNKKPWLQITPFRCYSWIILFVAISVLLVALSGVKTASAASFYFTSSATQVSINQTFKVDLFVDTENEQINAMGGQIVFPSGLLELQEVREGNSIISMWLEKPRNSELVFSGIIPGGYRDKNGLILSLIFKSVTEGQGAVSVHNGKVFLNDGQGSETQTKSIDFPFVAIRDSIREDSWVSPKDTERPESFMPEIAKDATLFDGKWFVVFATQDKASGVDHYEVREIRQWTRFENSLLFVKYFRRYSWAVAESPHVLRDQELRSFLFVKAVDKVGNERIIKIAPRNPLAWYENYENWIMIMIVIISIYFIRRTLWKKLLTHE